jgi:hypothetical protein
MTIGVYSCSDDNDASRTMPMVSISTPTDVTTTSAKIEGNITSDGNDAVSKSGIVFSSNVALPTVADNKVESTTKKGVFTAQLTGLSSGTTYHVRAFATNSIGTSYSDVIDFSTGNAAPTITGLTITGEVEVNKTLSATYSYEDSEGDAEGATSFQWYSAASLDGENEIIIDGATSKTFLVQETQQGKYIRVSVTPRAINGTVLGIEVKSNFTVAVGTETVTFDYNGQEVTYGIIKSLATQKKWLDRNIGAMRLAQSVDDYLAYGDLFQWGRLPDGHQLVTRSNGTDGGAEGVTGTTSTVSSTDIPSTNKFINGDPAVGYDWRNPPNNNLWQGVNSTNNPCPSGWKVPTQNEWLAEGITSLGDGFTKLKLTYTGIRSADNGSFVASTDVGIYWASSLSTEFPEEADRAVGTTAGFSISSTNRATANACRCIEE